MLTAGNIRSGVNIFNVVGTMVAANVATTTEYAYTGTYNQASYTWSFPTPPKIIVIWGSYVGCPWIIIPGVLIFYEYNWWNSDDPAPVRAVIPYTTDRIYSFPDRTNAGECLQMNADGSMTFYQLGTNYYPMNVTWCY